MNKKSKIICAPLLTTAAFLAIAVVRPAAAADVFYTYVPVKHVEPVVELRQVPVNGEVCVSVPTSDQLGRDRKLAGEIREREPGIGLTDAIRLDVRRRQNREVENHCKTVVRYDEVAETVGYRVTYRFRDTEYVRRMDKHPGERLRIKVRVEPISGSSRTADRRQSRSSR